jgi:hypothetical protein
MRLKVLSIEMDLSWGVVEIFSKIPRLPSCEGPSKFYGASLVIN